MKYYTKEYLEMRRRLDEAVSRITEKYGVSESDTKAFTDEIGAAADIIVRPYDDYYKRERGSLPEMPCFNGHTVTELYGDGGNIILKTDNGSAVFENARIIENETGFSGGNYICEEIYITGGYYEFHAAASRNGAPSDGCLHSRYAYLTLVCTDIKTAAANK